MKTSSDEYRFLLDWFKNTRIDDFQPLNKLKNISLYKVKEKSKAEVEVGDDEEDEDLIEVKYQKYNLMLLHGTILESLKEILSKGFKNSTAEDVVFGPGVYMTDCLDTAIYYSQTKHPKTRAICVNNISCIFVNEVLYSQQLQTECFDKWNFDSPLEYPFVKYYHSKSHQPTKNDYKHDMKKRLYNCTPVSKWSQNDEFVADETLVRPRYLFVVKTRKNEDNYRKNEDFIRDNL